MAPGLGLYLDELFFTGYNQKQVRDKEKRIQDSITSLERAQKKAKYGSLLNKDSVKASALLAVQKALQSSSSSSS